MTPEEEEAVKKIKIKLYARMIWSNTQFRKILMDAAPDKRRAVYELIRPHLRFKAKPYFLLMNGD